MLSQVNEISNRAMLASCHVGVFPNSASYKEADEVVAKHFAIKDEDRNKVGKFKAYKINPEHLKAMQGLATRLRNEHMRRTVAWGEDGKRALSNSAYFDYCSEMSKLISDFDAEYQNNFRPNFDSYVQEAKLYKNGMFNQDDYPASLEELDQKFYAKLDFAPMPVVDDFRRALTGEALDIAVQGYTSNLQDKLNNSIADIGERVVKVVKHCSESLKEYHKDENGKVRNKFHDTLISNIRDLAEALPQLNIASSPEIEKLASELQELCKFSPDSLRDSEMLRNETAKQADAILEKMKGLF